MITINRRSHDSALDTMKNVETFMLENRVNIGIAPGGTRRRKMSDPNDHSQNLAEFKKGPFHLAKNTETHIVPFVVYGAGRLLPSGDLTLRQGSIFLVL